MPTRQALFTRSLTRTYPEVIRGKGPWLWDAEGHRYLDFSASAVVSFIGHGDPDVARAIADQLDRVEFVHSSQFVTDVAEQFAREILDFAGSQFSNGAVFFTSGGSEANETALKLARQYQVEIGQSQRTQVLCRKQAYHGATIGAMSLSDNRKRKEIYSPLLREYPRVSTPYCYRCAYDCDRCTEKYSAEVDAVLDEHSDSLAAFFFEPISGATIGAAVPPDGYLQRATDACHARGVIVVADEVMTGFGRTGRNFAVDHWGVVPDILVVGKGIASGYLPLGAVIASRKIVDAIAAGSGTLVHGFTYNAHPVACAAGREVLRKTRTMIAEASSEDSSRDCPGAWLKRELQKLKECGSVGDVRGMGLLWGVEFVSDNRTKSPFERPRNYSSQVAAAATRRGLLTYPMQGCVDGINGDHIVIAPPATISEEEISWAVEHLIAAIHETETSKD